MEPQDRRIDLSPINNSLDGITPQKKNTSNKSENEKENHLPPLGRSNRTKKKKTPTRARPKEYSSLKLQSENDDDSQDEKTTRKINVDNTANAAQQSDDEVNTNLTKLSKSKLCSKIKTSSPSSTQNSIKDYENGSSGSSSFRDLVIMTEDFVADSTKRKKWSYSYTELKKTVKKILPRRKKHESIDGDSDSEVSLDPYEDIQTYEGPTVFHNACYSASSLEKIVLCYSQVPKTDREKQDLNGHSPLDLLFQNKALAKSLQVNDKSSIHVNFNEKEIMEVGIFALSIYSEMQCEMSWLTFKEWIKNVEDDEASKNQPELRWFPFFFNHSVDSNMRQSTSFDFDECQSIAPPIQVNFALEILTRMIDELNCWCGLRKNFQPNVMYSPGYSLDGSISDYKSNITFRRKRRQSSKDNKISDTTANPFICDQFHQDPKESSANLTHAFASIPNIMKTFLSIDDDCIRKKIFENQIIQMAMLSKGSIEGSWLGEMLQHHRRKRATEYLFLLSELTTKEARNAEQHDDDQKKLQLKELFQTIGELKGFLPSMLAVDNTDIEDLAITPMITSVLDQMISTPFASTLFFFDFILLGLLIFFFRSCVDTYLQRQEPHLVLKWLYATLFSAFHFQMRAIARVTSLIAMTRNDVFRNAIFFSIWTILHTACLFMVIWCIITIRFSAPRGEDSYLLNERVRYQFSITTLLLWFNLLGLVKSMNAKLATFVSAIVQIVKDVLWYVALIIGMVLCFSQVFYTLLIPSDCTQQKSIKECRSAEYYLITYSVLLGELDDDLIGGIENKIFALILFFGFSFIMAIVMLNILIAIISDSYEKSMLRSTKLFGRARVNQLAEILALQDLFHVRNDNKLPFKFFQWTSVQWTKGGFAFFTIMTCTYLLWVIIDINAMASELWYISLLVFLLNLVMFCIFLFLLAKVAQNVERENTIYSSFIGSIQNGIQWIMKRVLGKSHDTLLHDQWDGRLIYIKREIAASTKKIKHSLQTIQQESKNNEKQRREFQRKFDKQMKQFEQQMVKLLDAKNNIDKNQE